MLDTAKDTAKEVMSEVKRNPMNGVSYFVVAVIVGFLTWTASAGNTTQKLEIEHSKEMFDTQEAHRIELESMKEVHRKEQEAFLLGETDGHRLDEERREQARQVEVALREKNAELKIKVSKLETIIELK